MLDLAFPIVVTKPIPADHGYHLYAGLSRLLADVHAQNGIGVHPIRGRIGGPRLLETQPWSRVTIRTPEAGLTSLVKLAGQQIDLAGIVIRLGVPTIQALAAATTLRSRLVTIKGFVEPESFDEALRRQLADLSVSSEVIVTLGKRRTLRIKAREIVGYEVLLEGLSADESLRIQEQGLGGRRHMGCGIFVPHGDTK